MKEFDWEKFILIALSALLGAALLGGLLPIFRYTGKAMVIFSKLPEITLMLYWIALICGIIGLLGYFNYHNLLNKMGIATKRGLSMNKRKAESE